MGDFGISKRPIIGNEKRIAIAAPLTLGGQMPRAYRDPSHLPAFAAWISERELRRGEMPMLLQGWQGPLHLSVSGLDG